MAKLTIFTPAYNRAHLLQRTYKSLCSQTCKDFIWLIIDDGSTDNTKELVQIWQTLDKGFEIQYFYKENGGMHTAHNLAYEKITTELNTCLDSDDMMTENAVEEILAYWKEYGSNEVAGIIALDIDTKGCIIGTEMPDGIYESTLSDIYDKYNGKGDKKLIYRTDIIKSVEPYPVFEKEKLVPLSYKYILVDQLLPLLLLNKAVCIVDYQPDGSTNTIVKQYMQSPNGFAARKKLDLQYGTNFRIKAKAAVHYVADCRIAGRKDCISSSPLKLLTLVVYPIGILVEKHIKRMNNGRNR